MQGVSFWSGFGMAIGLMLIPLWRQRRCRRELQGKLNDLQHQLTERAAACADAERARGVVEASLQTAESRIREVLAAMQDAELNDSMTGLPRQALFADRLQNCIERARAEGKELAVVVAELVDRAGEAGSLEGGQAAELVCEASRRLLACVGAADTVARVGRTRFAAVLFEPDSAELAARRLVEALSAPYYLDEGTVTLLARIGLARYPTSGEEAGVLQKYAERALDQLRDNPQGGYRLHASGHRSAVHSEQAALL